MERRQSVRRPLTLNVVVDQQPARICRGRTTDISMTGVFVYTVARGLQRGRKARLVFTLDEEQDLYVYRLPVTIVRVSKGGVAATFDHTDGSSFEALLRLFPIVKRPGGIPKAAPVIG